jgi:uncharacterized DUF497 family protein
MRFSFDATKSLANKEKHGIDFVEAQELWEDSNRFILPVGGYGEERYLLIASRQGKIWTAVATDRDATIRLISVRRRRTVEEYLYETG